jgi:hypothetical protein
MQLAKFPESLSRVSRSPSLTRGVARHPSSQACNFLSTPWLVPRFWLLCVRFGSFTRNFPLPGPSWRLFPLPSPHLTSCFRAPFPLRLILPLQDPLPKHQLRHQPSCSKVPMTNPGHRSSMASIFSLLMLPPAHTSAPSRAAIPNRPTQFVMPFVSEGRTNHWESMMKVELIYRETNCHRDYLQMASRKMTTKPYVVCFLPFSNWLPAALE